MLYKQSCLSQMQCRGHVLQVDMGNSQNGVICLAAQSQVVSGWVPTWWEVVSWMLPTSVTLHYCHHVPLFPKLPLHQRRLHPQQTAQP